MVQLETVEDFEKVRKILDDPKSKPHEYCIKTFGFCHGCQKMTEYEGSYSIERCSETCLNCHRVFESKFGPYYKSSDGLGYQTILCEIQAELLEEFNRLHSREYQAKLFKDELEKYLKKLKHKSREYNNKIKRIAKLR